MPHPLVMGPVQPHRLAEKVALTADEQLYVDVNRLFYKGEHWQEGAGYIGPPPDLQDRNAGDIWQRLRRAFTSQNVTKEIVDRQVSAIYGNVPEYGFTVRRARKMIPLQVPDPKFTPDPANPDAQAPMIADPKGRTVPEPLTDEEVALINEAKAAMEVFYSKRKPLKWLKKLLRARLWGGRAYLRLYVPPKFRQTAKDLNEAVERIFISQPDIKDAVKLTDEETRDELAIVSYTRNEGKTKVFELAFTDDANRTFIATIEQSAPEPTANGNYLLDYSASVFELPAAPAYIEARAEQTPLANIPDDNISAPLDLNGHLTVYEMAGEPLVSEQIRSANKSINLNLTMANHVTVEHGFRELAVTNVEFEKEKVPDRYAPNGYREVPKRLKRGSGVIHNFVGMAMEDGQGNEQLAEPTVEVFDPVPIKSFDDGQNMHRRNALHETRQLWAEITGDAAPSGESRIQALADFIMFSLDFKEEADDAGAWMFETVLFWGAWLMGKPGRYSGLRANFVTRLYVGRLSAEERRLLMEEVKQRLRSREGYMLIVGDIPDPAEEKERIKQEDEESIEGQRARMSLEADRRALELEGEGDDE